MDNVQKPQSNPYPFTAIGAFTTHPNKQNLSFGRWSLSVMANKMASPDPYDRRRAVASMSDFVLDSRRIASKEFEGVAPVFRQLVRDEDDSVRLAVAKCFGSICATASGRRVFDKHDFYDDAMSLLDDDNSSVRNAINMAMQLLTISPMCLTSLVKSGNMVKLLDRIPFEENDTLAVLLQTLHSCAVIKPLQIVEAGGLKVIGPLLFNQCPLVKQRSITVIKDLATIKEGRNIAIELGILKRLLELCNDDDQNIKAKALAATMMVAVASPAKFLAIEEDAIEKILPLMDDDDIETRLNAIKVLTALSEAPVGREIMLKKIHDISVTLKDEVVEVRKATQKLIAVVTFEP